VPRHTCIDLDSLAFPLRLIQTDFDKFTVEYGKQATKGLDYTRAATELGACIMHALACDGHLDNRTRSEARQYGDSKPYFPAGG
jgi:hypothetical protein